MCDALDRLGPFLYQVQHLVKLGREQVERRQDPPVGTQIVPLPVSHMKDPEKRHKEGTATHTAS